MNNMLKDNPAVGDDALEFLDSILTKEEIEESNFRVALIDEMIKARNEKGVSQKRLEELSGVRQPIIARIEKGVSTPRIDTLMKILAPLGKTIAIVPIEK